MKKKFIVITGGAGFIGSNLIKYLLKKTKMKIISIDNYSTGSLKNHIKNHRIKYIKGKENIILSSLSYNPPCPLSKLPKSLIGNSLLIFD